MAQTQPSAGTGLRGCGFAMTAVRRACNRDRTHREEKAMSRGKGSLMAIAALAGVLAFNSGAGAQTAATPAENAAPTADNAVMLTIFFKHDQSRPLSELNAQLEKQGFYKAFPPPGTEVVSWYVMMGIGQVVTLRLPASRQPQRDDLSDPHHDVPAHDFDALRWEGFVKALLLELRVEFA